MIKIFNNLITPLYADAIEDDITRPDYPWLYLDDVTYNNQTTNPGLVSVIFDHGKPMSDWYPFIKPVLYQIADAAEVAIKQVLRIRVGFLLQEPVQPPPSTPHVDFLYPHYTSCYYINDSDGDTVIYDQTIAEVGADRDHDIVQSYVAQTKFTVAQTSPPRKGSACVFDGDHFHSSTNPYKNRKRLVITFNWI